MQTVLIASAVTLVIGILSVIMAWNRPRLRTIMICLIPISLVLTVLGWLTTFPVVVLGSYKYLSSFASGELGIPALLAKAVACLLVLPLVFGAYLMLRIHSRGWQRWVGVSLILATFAGLFFWGYKHQQEVQSAKQAKASPSGQARKTNYAPLAPLPSHISFPFFEDFSDGEYQMLRTAGNLQLVARGGDRSLCGDGIGPWSFELRTDQVPLTASRLDVWVFAGQGWQGEFVYATSARKIVLRYNWRSNGENLSCVADACNPLAILPAGWHTLSIKPIVTSSATGQDAYQKSMEAQRTHCADWGIFDRIDAWLTNAKQCQNYTAREYYNVPGSWNASHQALFTFTAQSRDGQSVLLASGETVIMQEQGETRGEAMRKLYRAEESQLKVVSIKATFRQPFHDRFCIGPVRFSSHASEDMEGERRSLTQNTVP